MVLLATIGAASIDIYDIVTSFEIVLADILLMFLYTEVISMVGTFYSSRKIPVVYPIFIAITALSRLIVLQSKDMEPEQMLYEAIAVGVLGITIGVLRFSDRIKTSEENT